MTHPRHVIILLRVIMDEASENGARDTKRYMLKLILILVLLFTSILSIIFGNTMVREEHINELLTLFLSNDTSIE